MSQHANRRPRARYGLGFLVLGVVGAAAVVAGSGLDAGTAKNDFETTIVVRGDIEENVTALGKLQPREYVDVGAQASGQLLRLHVREGDKVRSGQLLAEIDATLQQAQVEGGQAEIQRLQAQLVELEAKASFARLRAERQQLLAHKHVTSSEERERAEMDAKVAGAQIEMTRAQIQQTNATLRSNEAQLRYTKVFAPIDGTVVSIDARQGQTLVATYQTPHLLRIADLTVMTVWAQVAEADVPRLRPGMRVWFRTLGHPDRRWESRVRQVLPGPVRANPTTAPSSSGGSAGTIGNNVVTYTAVFDVSNPDGELRPEMSAQTFFIVQHANDALTAPVSALQPVDGEADRFFVRVLGKERIPESRLVRSGVRTRFKAEIIEGLSEGEHVITAELEEEGRSNIRFKP